LGAHRLNSEYVGDGCTSDSMLCGRWWRRGGEARMVAAILTMASLLLIQAVTSIRVRADVVSPVQVGRAQGWLAPATPVPAAGATALVIAGDPIVSLAATHPEAPTLYAVGFLRTHQAENAAALSRGLYRSDDGGSIWRRSGSPPQSGHLVAAPDGSLLLSGDQPSCARGGDEPIPLARSMDSGATWQVVEGVADIRPLAAWSEPRVALSTSCGGLYLSLDSGATWQPASFREEGAGELARISGEVTSSAVVAGQTAILLGTTSEGGSSQLWRLDLADPMTPVLSGMTVFYRGVGALAGREQLYVVGTQGGILISADGGQSWREHQCGLDQVTVSAVEVLPGRPTLVQIGTDNGLLYAPLDPRHADACWSSPMLGVEGPIRNLVAPLAGARVFVQTEKVVVSLPASP
jgi:hypothetical protein